MRHHIVFGERALSRATGVRSHPTFNVPTFSPANRNVSSSASSESSQSPLVEAGGSHGHMSPEEHYRRMMSALSEQGTYEEQQQRLYQLASSMGLPGHGQCTLMHAHARAHAVRLSSPVIYFFIFSRFLSDILPGSASIKTQGRSLPLAVTWRH